MVCLIRICFVALASFATLCSCSNSTAQEPSEVLARATALWHMRSPDDSNNANSALVPHGEVRLGVELDDRSSQDSMKRGGDGFVADLTGGWLDAGQGADDELQLHGEAFTALLRMKVESASLWSTRGFFTKGGGHDQQLFNFFSHDFGQGPDGMRVGFELGIAGHAGLGGQVMALVPQIGPIGWHDFVARYDGKELSLWVDGVAVDRKPVMGQLRNNDRFPVAIGSGGAGDAPLACLIDHAAIWNEPLSDADIVALSGGDAVAQATAERLASWIAPPARPSTSSLLEASRQLTQLYQNDRHRPRFHFLHCEEGDIMPGDPNGAIYWKGRYHLFYIFQRHQDDPPATIHCWGHASSIDLLHWEHHPTALDVADNDPDRGIFSGNALVDRNGRPTLIYHGVGLGNCMAQANDDRLIDWTKSPLNPLVPIPASGDSNYGKYDSWDPHAWLESDEYFAIFGGNPGTGAPPTLFRGPELTKLEYVGPFLPRDRWSLPGEDVSCPDFFPLGEKHVLLCISHMLGARYFVGEWKDARFTPESHGRMNWPGGCFFAPETLVDARGRRIVWAWCLDERPSVMRASGGWSGVMSLPRVLGLDDQGRMTIEPVEELERLRINPVEIEQVNVPAGGEVVLSSVLGDCIELWVEFPSGLRDRVSVDVRRSPDARESTRIEFDPQSQQLSIDVSKSSLDPAIRYKSWCLFQPPDAQEASRRVTEQVAPLELNESESLKLRIYVDRSMLEVFANGRQCLTQRIWPVNEDSLGVSLRSEGESLVVPQVRAWEIGASNRD